MTKPASISDIGVLDYTTYASGDATTFGLPLDQFEYLHEHAPIYLQEFDDPRLQPKLWVISRHADCDMVDRDNIMWRADKGPSNMWSFAPLGDHIGIPSMITSDEEPHRAQRQKIGRMFRPGAVKTLEERFRGYAREVVDNALAKGEPFNFVEVIAHEMPLKALGEVLGVPEEDRPKFFRYVDVFASAFDERVAASFDEVMAAIQGMYAYALELADHARENPGANAMTLMVQDDEDGTHLADNAIQGNVTLLASGAAESTRNSLSHGMHELLRNEEAMQFMRDNAGDVPYSAVHEILRIAAPFTHLCRYAAEDTELLGQEVKEGDTVAMLFAAANFDRSVFDNPREFDLQRDPNPHMSFGAGPHSCLGKHVAAMEIKVLFEELFQRTKEIKPSGDIDYIHDAYSRGVYELPVELVPA